MIQEFAIIRTLSSPGPITKANPTETTMTRRNANRSPRQYMVGLRIRTRSAVGCSETRTGVVETHSETQHETL